MVEALPEKSAATETAEAEAQSTTTTTATETESTPAAQDGPTVIDLTDTSNVPVTDLTDWKTEHSRKCQVFMDWCFENGCIMPKI